MWTHYYLDMSYLVISHDMGYDIITYRDISCDITPDHLETSGKYKFNENPPPRCGLLLFFRLCLCPHGLSCVWPFLLSFCYPSAWHMIALTVPPENSNLVPSGLGLLPERVHVCFFSFFILFFYVFFCLSVFFFVDTWYPIFLIAFAR